MVLCSQEKKLTHEELTPGGKNFQNYRPKLPKVIGWHGENLTYVSGDTIYTAPLNSKQKSTPLITTDELNANLGLDGNNKLTKGYYNTRWTSPSSDDLIIYKYQKTIVYDSKAKKPKASFATKDFENQTLAPNNLLLAYTKENNLFVQSSEGVETAITNESDKGIVCGQSVHRNEFGINGGIFWSPSSNKIAFYRMDETMVTDYPLVDISTRIAEAKPIKYPMAGMKSHHVTIGIYDIATKQTSFLKTGTPKEKYLTNIAWSPDEKHIYLAELNRGQDTCALKCYNVLNGKLEKTLFTETHAKYVEPLNPVMFLKNKPEQFIWQSKRDGYNHLYLYNTSGELIKQLTKGNWEVVEMLGFDSKEENLFYISTEASPVNHHAYKLNLKTGKRTQLTQAEGMHNVSLSASGKYICDTYSSVNNPGMIEITETNKGNSYNWKTAKNPFEGIEMPKITLGTIKAADGKSDLHYRLLKPLNYDPSKKYPTIVYVYGGPHSQLVENSWMGRASGWDVYMAREGYVIFTVDNRGTQYRGIDFENVTHRQLGVEETKDQMKGVEFLKSLSFVDQNRIGVYGWSFGGFMTLNLMLRHSDVFKVGVAGGPVTDWKYYEIMYGERYMDSPRENPKGYKETNMVERAGDLKGRLLLIHGDEDPTVVMQHNLQFIKSAIKKGTHPDLFIYPGHGHNMIGHDRVHLMEHITRYFDDFLK